MLRPSVHGCFIDASSVQPFRLSFLQPHSDGRNLNWVLHRALDPRQIIQLGLAKRGLRLGGRWLLFPLLGETFEGVEIKPTFLSDLVRTLFRRRLQGLPKQALDCVLLVGLVIAHSV